MPANVVRQEVPLDPALAIANRFGNLPRLRAPVCYAGESLIATQLARPRRLDSGQTVSARDERLHQRRAESPQPRAPLLRLGRGLFEDVRPPSSVMWRSTKNAGQSGARALRGSHTPWASLRRAVIVATPSGDASISAWLARNPNLRLTQTTIAATTNPANASAFCSMISPGYHCPNFTPINPE